MRFIEWVQGAIIWNRTLLQVMVWLSIVLTLVLAVYVGIHVSIFWGVVVAFATLLIAPLLYMLLVFVVSLITLPFRRLAERGRSE